MCSEQNTSTAALISASPLYPTRVLAPDAGIRYFDDGWDNGAINMSRHIGTLVPLQEGDSPWGFKESPMAGFGEHLAKLIDDAIPTGPRPRLCCWISAHGGFTLQQLMQGSNAYQQALHSIRLIVEAEALQGREFRLPVALYNQGESDAAQTTLTPTPVPVLAKQLIDFQRKLSADVREIIPRNGEITIAIAQTNYVNSTWAAPAQVVQLAQIEAAKQSPYIILAGPRYQLAMEVNAGDTPAKRYSGQIHQGGIGVNKAGQMLSRAVFDQLLGVGGWTPTSLLRAELTSPTTIRAWFHVPRGGNLFIDTSGTVVSTTGILTSCGFDVLPANPKAHADTGFALAAPITGVALVAGANAVDITLASPVSYGCRLAYAMRRSSPALMDGSVGGATDGPVGGARGLLRGSVSHVNLRDGSDNHDWCVQFCEPILGSVGVLSVNGQMGAVYTDFVEACPVAPTVDLVLTAPEAVRPDWFSRGTVGYRRRSSGLLESVAANVLRIEAAANGVLLGGLFEGFRTNSLLYSATLSNAAWTKTRCAVAAAPSIQGVVAGTTMWKLTEDSTASQTHRMSQTLTINGQVTYSHYVRVAERSRLRLQLNNGTDAVTADFNIATGAVTTSTSGAGTGVTGRIVDCGGGLYRLVLTGTVTGTVVAYTYIADNAGASTYTGDGSSGLYVDAFQAEAGSTESSYLVTTTAAVSRNPDVLTIPTDTTWWNPAEGTFYVESVIPLALPSFGGLLTLDDGTANNSVMLHLSPTFQVSWAAYVAGTGTGSGSWQGAAGQAIKAVLSYRAGAQVLAVNGTLGAGGTGAVPASLTTLRVADRNAGIDKHYGTIRRASYVPRALDAATAQRITA